LIINDGGSIIQITDLIYIIAACKIIILIVLVDNFIRIYNNFRSNFTLGFLLFVTFLLIKNVFHAFLLLPLIILGDIHASSTLGYNVVIVALVPDTLELIALSLFLYFTREY